MTAINRLKQMIVYEYNDVISAFDMKTLLYKASVSKVISYMFHTQPMFTRFLVICQQCY
jgi:hypothetical protein